MKLLLTMGALFQTIAALWLAKVVRDNAIPGRVTATDWLLAVVGGLAALGITWGAVISEWEKMGDSALGVLTGLAFNLFSTFFFVSLSRKPCLRCLDLFVLKSSKVGLPTQISLLWLTRGCHSIRPNWFATTRNWRSGGGMSLSAKPCAAAARCNAAREGKQALAGRCWCK